MILDGATVEWARVVALDQCKGSTRDGATVDGDSGTRPGAC